MWGWTWKLGVVATVLVSACASETGDESGDAADEALSSHRELSVVEDTALLAEHPDTLKELEARGFDLGTRLTGGKLANNAALATTKEGAAIIAAVQEDFDDAHAADRGVGVGMAFGHRAFDKAWLASSKATFELVAVSNRLDRRHATPNACGELHLVYRLSYTTAVTSSRLPMTVMLVYPQTKVNGACTTVASAWTGTRSATTATTKADALAKGPLAAIGKAPRVETNFQLVRWPSTTRTDMGGHAEYSLRVFERDASGALEPYLLENTPRTDLDDAEKATLATWVKDNLPGIDRGTAKVPDALLSGKGKSVSPKGLSRAQNRPFAELFGKDGKGLDVSAANLGGLALVGSKAALVRRLDTLSCQGCHQAQGLAGFQILGHDRREMSDVNALIEGVSPHVREQVAFRKKDLATMAAGSMDLAPIPFAERSPNSGAFDDEGGYGSACGLGDAGFAKWTCAGGMTCSDINGDDIGICVSSAKVRTAGEACEEATVSFVADPHKDKVTIDKVLSCTVPGGGAGRCVRSGGDPGGFPTGMCGGGCTTMGKVQGDAICGVAVPSGFNECIGAGKPFETCTAGGPKAYRRACSAKSPCGPDYVCSAVPGAPTGEGACLPPYFIFQARVDGHIVK